MRRPVFWILVSLATFGLGAAAAFAWLGGFRGLSETPGPVPPPEDEIIAAESPVLPYCELADHPEKYDGRVVRVVGRLYFTMHGYYFLDKGCDDEAKQAGLIIAKGSPATWDAIESKIAQDLRLPEHTPWEFPEIIARGRFRRVEPSRASDAVQDNTHLLFEIIEVERASRSRAE